MENISDRRVEEGVKSDVFRGSCIRVSLSIDSFQDRRHHRRDSSRREYLVFAL